MGSTLKEKVKGAADIPDELIARKSDPKPFPVPFNKSVLLQFR
jgi:hypothetical protein